MMKNLQSQLGFASIIALVLFFIPSIVLSQLSLFQQDNGEIAGTSNINGYEEACLLAPPAPCYLNKVQVYLQGGQPCKDTLWIAQDPTDGNQPPTIWVMHYAAYAEMIFDYTGEGWYEFDVSSSEIQIGGYTRVAILHHCGENRPGMAYDSQAETGNTYQTIKNYVTDVYKPNPDFYNIAGTLMYRANGHYLCRLIVDYITTPENKPAPTMLDVTQKAGLIYETDNTPIRNPMASVADWNNDGFDDVASGGRFFLNNQDGTFTNVTSTIGISGSQTAWGDIDNDGNMDCFVNNGGLTDKIYWGNGDGTFTGIDNQVLQLDQPDVTPLLFDYNQDGLLDIYIAYGRRTIDGAEVYYQDHLFKNIDGRTFEDVTDVAGITAAENPDYDCWGATICDFNRDGLADIFVATYRLAPDFLYRNNGDGTFTEIGKASGAAGMKTNDPNYFGHGMGADWGDYDNDGDYDLIVGNLGHPDSRGLVSNPSLILENQGSETEKFINKTSDMRLLFFEMNGGIVFADLNNDSYLDIVHALYSYYTKADGSVAENHTRFYLNQGPEKDYAMKDMTWFWGSEIHGAWCPIRTDYDNDGDMDIYVCSSNDYSKFFENQLPDNGNWCEVRLYGEKESGMNSTGIGAEVILEAGGKTYIRGLFGTVSNGRTSQSTNMLHFGLGNQGKIDKITVNWNNQDKDNTTIENPPANWILKIGKNGLLDMPNQAMIAMDKANIEFGIIDVEQIKTETITIKNIGTDVLDITKIELIEQQAEKGVITLLNNPAPTSLAPDESLTLEVEFAPKIKAEYTATLLIENNAANKSIANIAIHGRGYAPSGEIASEDKFIDFETVLIDESKTIPLEIKNIGEADLTITEIIIPSEMALAFSVVGTELPLTITTGGTENISLKFKPIEEKVYQTQITIVSDAYLNPAFKININGAGEAKKAYITTNTQSIDFPGTLFGETSTQEILITNTGNKPLTISEFEFVMDKDNAYAIKDYEPPYIIEANNEREFTITFSPIKTLVNKSMKIHSDAYNEETISVALRGKGIDPNIVLDSPEQITSLSISIAPNPARDKARLDITITQDLEKPIMLNIIDINGKSCKEIRTEFKMKGTYTLDLNIDTFATAMYYITEKTTGLYIPLVIE